MRKFFTLAIMSLFFVGSVSLVEAKPSAALKACYKRVSERHRAELKACRAKYSIKSFRKRCRKRAGDHHTKGRRNCRKIHK